jgi:hypothetical protein
MLQADLGARESEITELRLGVQAESCRAVIDKLTKRRSFVSICLLFCYLRAMLKLNAE